MRKGSVSALPAAGESCDGGRLPLPARQHSAQYGSNAGRDTCSPVCLHYLRALAVLALYRGEVGQAIEYLQEAGSLSEEIGLPGELWSIQAALGELHLKQGDAGQARSCFALAAPIVRALADTLANEKQRIDFLASPLIRQILEQ